MEKDFISRDCCWLLMFFNVYLQPSFAIFLPMTSHDSILFLVSFQTYQNRQILIISCHYLIISISIYFLFFKKEDYHPDARPELGSRSLFLQYLSARGLVWGTSLRMHDPRNVSFIEPHHHFTMVYIQRLTENRWNA